MLSGEFGSIAISSIQPRPDGDVRRTVKDDDITELMESIAARGLMHPIVITREDVLVAGKTRLTACTRLGWTHIPYQYEDDLDPRQHLALELEENIKRKGLDWKDECDGLLRLHKLYAEQNEGWTQGDTAKEIGWSQNSVSERLAVAEKLIAGDARVSNAKQFSVARGITRRVNERAAADELSNITVDMDEPAGPEAPIVNANFLEWVETYTGPPFNFLHCDFPYGVNADKFQQGAADAFGGYEDKPETYWALVKALVNNKERLLGSSGHILFWFSMRYYTETLAVLKEHFWVDNYPLIWHKSDNKGTLPDPERGPRRVYEVAFLCSHGDRKILSAVSNTFSGPTIRDGEHMSEKSQDMLQHFFRMCVDGGTRMLDPTCGSGSALRAADALGASSILGLELNPEFADNAVRAWNSRNG